MLARILSVATSVALLVADAFALPGQPIATQPAATQAQAPRAVRFLAIGDPQYWTQTAFEAWGDRLVAAEGLRPDFAIALGDLTGEGLPREFDWYKAAVARPNYPVYGLPGNHDVEDTAARSANYVAALGPLLYSFDFGGHHFICYDGTKPKPAWLTADLAEHRGQHIVLAQHYTPARKLAEQLRAAGAVAIFSGHVHANRRCVNSGSLDANVNQAINGFLLVDLAADGQVKTMWRPNTPRSLRLLHPSPDVASAGGEQTHLLVDAFDTNVEIPAVEYDAGAGWQPMQRVGWRSWAAQAKLDGVKTVRLRATPRFPATQPWEVATFAIPAAAKSLPAVRAVDDWPVWGHTSRNDRSLESARGDSPAAKANPASPVLAWWTNLNGMIRDGGPIVVAGRVYLTVESQDLPANNGLVCLDAATGKTLWRRQLPCSTTGAAAFCHSVVAVATLGDQVLAFDPATGEPRWQADTRGMYNTYARYGRLTADGETFYAGNMTAIDPADGKVRWTAQHAQSAYGTPAIGEGFIVGFGGYSSYCLRLADRKAAWRHTSSYAASVILDSKRIPPHPPASQPSATQPGDEAEAIFAGGQRVRLADRFVIWSQPLVRDGGCLAGDCFVVMCNTSRTLAGISLQTGKPLWQKLYPRGFRGSVPAYANGVAWFAGSDGRLHGVEAATGKTIDGPAVGWPAGDVTLSGNAVFVACEDGNVLCFVRE